MDTINKIIFKSCVHALVKCKITIKEIIANEGLSKSEKTVRLECVQRTVKLIDYDMCLIAVEGCDAHTRMIKNIDNTRYYLKKKFEDLLITCKICYKKFKYKQSVRNHEAKFHGEEITLR